MTEPARTEAEAPLDVEDLRDKYLRALADLDNLRKRTNKEIQQARDEGESRAAVVFLPVIDDFHRAIESITQAKRLSKKDVLDGMQLLMMKFAQALRLLEIEGFEARGQAFAVQLMEAITQVPTKALPPGTVVDELERGFTRRGKLLRPARVAVAIDAPDEEDPHG
jgi:molecular chaperone GrpE